MTCVDNKYCHLNWPCQQPNLAIAGSALIVTALVVGLLAALVSKGAIGNARLSLSGAVVLTGISLTLAAIGGVLIGQGIGQKSAKSLPAQGQ